MMTHRKDLERLLQEGPGIDWQLDMSFPSYGWRMLPLSETERFKHAEWCARVTGLAALVGRENPPPRSTPASPHVRASVTPPA